ncbi:hypothetical protein TNCV_777871 [Trichonephila clavipes]|nr:hypothetical protein TNCV_777871 [Trichonephila clavipes]
MMDTPGEEAQVLVMEPISTRKFNLIIIGNSLSLQNIRIPPSGIAGRNSVWHVATTCGRALSCKMITPPDSLPRQWLLIFFLGSCNGTQYVAACVTFVSFEVVTFEGIHDANGAF